MFYLPLSRGVGGVSDVLRAAVAQSHLNHNVGGWFPGYPYDYSDYIIFLAVHVKKERFGHPCFT